MSSTNLCCLSILEDHQVFKILTVKKGRRTGREGFQPGRSEAYWTPGFDEGRILYVQNLVLIESQIREIEEHLPEMSDPANRCGLRDTQDEQTRG